MMHYGTRAVEVAFKKPKYFLGF